MSEKRLRIGFIGCGSHASMCIYPCLRMGAANIFNKIKIPAELVAVADLNEDRARYNARTFGALRHYTDHKAMLAKEEIDAVFIVAGAHLHKALILDALASGRPVFVEKPPALSSKDTWELVEASRKAKQPVMTAFMKRFATGYRMAHEISKRPEFGGVRFISARMTGGGTGGDGDGFLKDYAIHMIDLVHFLGGDFDEITCYKSCGDGKPAMYSVSARYTSGALGSFQFHTCQGAGVPSETVEISGLGHHVTVDNVTDLKYFRAPLPPWDRPEQQIDLMRDSVAFNPNWTMPRDDNSSLFHLGYAGEVAHFVNSILDGTPLQSDIVAAHKDMVFVEALQASNGKPVKINYGL